MAASGPFATAGFDADPRVGEPQTFFTQYLLDAVEEGLPNETGGLALGTLFNATSDALARDRRPLPTRSVRHEADRFVIARNRAVRVTDELGLMQGARTVPQVVIESAMSMDTQPELRQGTSMPQISTEPRPMADRRVADWRASATPLAPGRRSGRAQQLKTMVLAHFATLPPDTPLAVREIEEHLDLPGKTLAGILDAMDKDPDSPVYRADAVYPRTGVPHNHLYRGFAYKALDLPQ